SIMILALAFLAAAAVTSHSVPLNNCDKAGIRSFTAINNNFGLGLLKIFGEREEGNIFFSPSSLSALLSAIFYGSAGKTREELVGLGYLSIQYEDLGSFNPLLGYCLEIANTLKSQSDEYTLERSNAILVEKDYP
ncbi:serpin family protein, partial [Staphylococcus aureus]|uniref:serpin family protein n=1 Tax=Staphylococcus aureus TaxID=1280 RepID=UPI0038B3BB21